MSDKRVSLWLWKNAEKYRHHIGYLVLLQTLISGGAICYALAMKKTVDSAIEQDVQEFWIGLILFALLIVTQLILRMVLRYLEENTRSGLENRFKEVLFSSLLQKDYAQVSAVHSEEWMNRMTSDTVVCGSGMTEILPGFFGMLVRMLGAMCGIFLLQPRLAYIMVPCGIVFIGITFVLRKYLKRYHKNVQEKDGKVRVFLQERISSMLVLHTFGTEKSALDGAKRHLKEHKQERMKKAIVSNLANVGFSGVINGMYLLGIGFCGYGILKGNTGYGTLMAITQLIGQLQVPLAGLGGVVPRIYSMLASAERLMEIDEYKDMDTGFVKSVEESRTLYTKELKEIVFDHVSFDYTKNSDRDPVLQDFTMSVQKGDYVAITGTSGCGKSTMLKLLMGIYEPVAGTVAVVLADGSRISAKELRRLFAYVPQGNYLMGGTIAEVITFGNEEKSVDFITIEEAMRLACASFVYDLPEGVNTLLGEKGAGLSEGQLQRIAIARALYSNAPVLILDEATSALDEETEKQLLDNLKSLTDKTVFIVTHRPEALKICNRKFEF